MNKQFILKLRSYSTKSYTFNKVVVFGGNGFLGKYVLKSFLNDPYTQVQTISRKQKLDSSLISLGNQILSPIKGDITKPETYLKALEDASAVVNLVGIMHPDKEYSFEKVHVDAVEELAKITKEKGLKLVHISAIGADSKSELNYFKTKGLGELKILEQNPNAIILRPSLVFGPEDEFFNRFAKLAKLLPIMPVFGSGMSLFQPVYVWDLARAITLSLQGPHQGKTFEIGGPNVYTYRDLIALVLKTLEMRRLILSIPVGFGLLQAQVLKHLPGLFKVTPDQVRQLQLDNKVNNTLPGLSDLGIQPTPLEKVLPTYLRPHSLTTKNKRTHKMDNTEWEKSFSEALKLKAEKGGRRASAPDLGEQVKKHLEKKY